MKINKIVIFHFLVLIGLFLLYIPGIFNLSIFNGFSYGDSEVAAFIAYILGKGGKMYQDFSIVYGPGRFIGLAGINKLFGVSISVPLFQSYSFLIARVLVPWSIYWVTYKILNKNNKYFRIVLGLVAATIYSLLLRSGQDTHLVILLFVGFYAWHQQTDNKLVSILAGIFLGLIGFFRIESGIFAFIAVLIAELMNYKKEKNNIVFYTSYVIFQIFYFLLILFYGSLPNFFHDVVLMGVLAQPKIMKIFIQPVDYPLFEFFMILDIFSVLVAIKDKNKTFLVLAILSLLGFANALGRADFDHLYYGIVLLVPTIVIAVYKLIANWKLITLEKISIKAVISTILLITLEVFLIKKQMNILLVVILCGIFTANRWLKNKIGLMAVFMMVIACRVMIRSESLFSFYLKRQLEIPKVENVGNSFKQILKYFSEAKKGNYAGCNLNEINSQSLVEMKQDLDGKTLFIYPSHASLYQALGKKPLNRYLYFNNEYTSRMETETVKVLSEQKIEYVLVSNNLTKADAIVPNQTKIIQGFIDKNYAKEKEYFFGEDKMILMKIKKSL